MGYGHLLSAFGAKKGKVEEPDREAEEVDAPKAPSNDQSNGKKSSKKSAKEKYDDKKMESDGEDDRDEKEEEEEGEGDEKKEDEQEEDEDKKEDELDKKRSKKSKKASGSESDYSAGRKAERARIRQIFKSPHAAGKLEQACMLALESSMSAENAIAILACSASNGGKRASIDNRMQSYKNPTVGVDGPENKSGMTGPITEEALAKMEPAQRAAVIMKSWDKRREGTKEAAN